MNDETVRLSTVGRILRGRWRLLILLTAAGALIGAGAAVLLSPGYTTSTSVLLQGPRQTDELKTAVQVAQSSTVMDRAAAGLGWNVSGAELVGSVTVDVLDGNVIAVRGTADTPEKAQQLSDQIAAEYVRFATQLANQTGQASAQLLQEQQQALKQEVDQASKKITDLAGTAQGVTVDSIQLRSELQSLRTALTDATKKLSETQGAAGPGNIVVMGPAERPTGRAAPTVPQLAVGGGVVFFLIGLFGHLARARADKRLRGETEIAAALGTRLLVSLDVPEDSTDEKASWLQRVRHWLLQDNRPWDLARVPVAHSDLRQDRRYQRVVTRLGGGARTVRHVVVLTADDDPSAKHAVSRLVDTASEANTGGTVEFRVVHISADRPSVPEDTDVSGALVVVTAGTRTPWELVGIAEACGDAGHEVLGAVVTHRALPAGEPPAKETEEPADRVLAGSP